MADTELLQRELEKLGLWNAQGPDGRHRYRYRLIPGEFRLTKEMKLQLGDIATLTTSALQASKQFATMLEDRFSSSFGGSPLTPKEAAFRKMLKATCGGYAYVPEHAEAPPIVKVDLAWDGTSFQIVEIDSYNPRGMAYGFWLRYAHVHAGESSVARDALLYSLLSEVPSGTKLVWLYSDRERYYAPVLRAFASTIADFGIDVRVVSESEMSACASTSVANFLADNEKLMIVPDRMHTAVDARNNLVRFALDAPERVIFPYAPHLGAKGLLAMLTNGNDDSEIASWNEEFLSIDAMALVREYIPTTAILGKQFTKKELPDFVAEGDAVLKAINSSGAKDVYMPHHVATYEAELSFARAQKSPNFIAQQLVRQAPMSLLGSDGPEEHFVRVTAYVSTRTGTCLDAELTGTGNDPLVHGGSSCVQLPAIF